MSPSVPWGRRMTVEMMTKIWGDAGQWGAAWTRGRGRTPDAQYTAPDSMSSSRIFSAFVRLWICSTLLNSLRCRLRARQHPAPGTALKLSLTHQAFSDMMDVAIRLVISETARFVVCVVLMRSVMNGRLSGVSVMMRTTMTSTVVTAHRLREFKGVRRGCAHIRDVRPRNAVHTRSATLCSFPRAQARHTTTPSDTTNWHPAAPLASRHWSRRAH